MFLDGCIGNLRLRVLIKIEYYNDKNVMKVNISKKKKKLKWKGNSDRNVRKFGPWDPSLDWGMELISKQMFKYTECMTQSMGPLIPNWKWA